MMLSTRWRSPFALVAVATSVLAMLLAVIIVPAFAFSDDAVTPTICDRYPPHRRALCEATMRTHLLPDHGTVSPLTALPATSRAKIDAFMAGRAAPKKTATVRVDKVAKRLQRVLSSGVEMDRGTMQSDHFTAAAVTVHQVASVTRFAPVLAYADASTGNKAIQVLSAYLDDGTVSAADLTSGKAGLNLESFAAQAVAKTISGVLTCYDKEKEQGQDAPPSVCDVETLMRLTQLLDALVAWLDATRARTPFAALLQPIPTLAAFFRTLPSPTSLDTPNARLAARLVTLDLVSTALTLSLHGRGSASATAPTTALTDLYFLPMHFDGGRPITNLEVREAAWLALMRVQELGHAVRETKAAHPFWFKMMRTGMDWVLGPIAKMVLEGAMQTPEANEEL
ncbi:hypothetical protein AMAG_00513 [Allomyces macrogynus ATCC 38327]|uniref:Uncharacterized protein n=1 Tax=Allomyces macrogynus (strain ATCC 38327) TaxID=578462 RepID=A0A0L0RW53_ALLM3|nr:hypothetical protein AMAG_00513 [Allomyces macrogynus ATCC 38327]|eukprot:KNE54543.1 hypothetical protein AMAG_00513 [Allomyces macrogynus ATCC 38327]